MATLPTGILISNFTTVSQGERGNLTFVEGNTHIPFEIERVFWIYGVSDLGVVRGGHAHKECEQVIMAVSGDVFVEVDRLTYHLYNPSQGIYIPRETTVKMYGFSTDCVLLVLCSRHFSEDDYIQTINGR